MKKALANQKKPNDATVEKGMMRGVNTGLMPKIEKGLTQRGAGAATKGKKFSKNG